MQGRKCTAYPAVKLNVILGGATWLEPDPIHRCFTDGNLVTGAAWPGHPEFVAQFMALLGLAVSFWPSLLFSFFCSLCYMLRSRTSCLYSYEATLAMSAWYIFLMQHGVQYPLCTCVVIMDDEYVHDFSRYFWCFT